MTNAVTEIKNLKTVINTINTNIMKIRTDITDMKIDIKNIYNIVSKLNDIQDVAKIRNDIPLCSVPKCSVTSQAFVALHHIFPLKTKEQLDQLEKDQKRIKLKM